MAVKKITEITAATSVKQDASVLITQPEAVTSGDGTTTVESVRRAPMSEVADAILAAKEKETNTAYANALKASVSGVGGVAVSDVSPLAHTVTVKLRNKNIIQYPYAVTTKTDKGITWTDNGDGTVTANGTAAGDSFFAFSYSVAPPASGEYTLSGCPVGGGGTKYYIYAYDGSNRIGTDYGSGRTVSVDAAKTYRVYAMVANGTTVNNITFKPQFEYGATATTYTPYVSDFSELTVYVRHSATDTDAQTYTPTADGTVPGVTSMAPNMAITASADIIIDVTYNRDICHTFAQSTKHTLYVSTNKKGYDPETDTYYTLTSALFDAVKAHPAQYKVYLASGSYCYPCSVDIVDNGIKLSCMVYDAQNDYGYTYTTYYVGDWTSSGIVWTVWDVTSDPCLIEGTPINMADGREVAVENLRAGDIVQSYNPVTGENVPAVVIAAYMTGAARKYKVYSFANGKHLTIYGLHGFYDKRSGATKDIQTITMDDRPVDISGAETQLITSRELLFHGEKKRRYNVITSNNLYFANGILLGSKPFSRMQYVIDRNLTVPDEIRAVWQADTDAYNAYSAFLNNPAYHAEIAAAYSNLAKAVHAIKVNKKRLLDSDYKVQKFTEGLLTLAEWAEAKTSRAAWRKAVNDNEVLRDTAKATVDAIIAKYRGGKTPRAIFEECCTRDNALYETVKAYFAQSEEAVE